MGHVSSQHGHYGPECPECGKVRYLCWKYVGSTGLRLQRVIFCGKDRPDVILQDCDDEEGLAIHALTHKVLSHLNVMPSQPNSNKTQFPKCILGRGWVSFLISMFGTSFQLSSASTLPQINVCRGCGKKFNTEELLGFHEKECLQCRPHRSEIVSVLYFFP